VNRIFVVVVAPRYSFLCENFVILPSPLLIISSLLTYVSLSVCRKEEKKDRESSKKIFYAKSFLIYYPSDREQKFCSRTIFFLPPHPLVSRGHQTSFIPHLLIILHSRMNCFRKELGNHEEEKSLCFIFREFWEFSALLLFCSQVFAFWLLLLLLSSKIRGQKFFEHLAVQIWKDRWAFYCIKFKWKSFLKLLWGSEFLKLISFPLLKWP
jgi:hypothetical protein